MAFKDNIDSQIRGFYFSQSGDSNFDGATFERPKRTIQEAIDAAALLSPPPGRNALAVISSAQGGSFFVGFILQDFIQFDGQNVSISSTDAVGITMASFQLCEVTSVTMINAFATGFLIDGQDSLAVKCDRINLLSASSKGIEIKGACDNLFFTAKQLLLNADDDIGFDITSSSPAPIDINVDTVDMTGDNTIFVNYAPVNSTDDCIVDVSTIGDGGSNTTGFIVENGHLVVQLGSISVTTAIRVKSSSKCSLMGSRVTGDIIVDSGGELDCIIIEHVFGTITNNGTINGIINGVRFGTWIVNILDTITDETDIEKVLNPDGVGGVEWNDPQPIYYTVMASWKDPDTGEFLQFGSTDTDDAAAVAPVNGIIRFASVARSNTSAATLEIVINGGTPFDLDTSAESTTYTPDLTWDQGDKLQVKNADSGTSKVTDAVVLLIVEIL